MSSPPAYSGRGCLGFVPLLFLASPPLHDATDGEPPVIWGTHSGYHTNRLLNLQRNVRVARQNAAEMTEEGNVREEGAVEQLDPGDVGRGHSDSRSAVKRRRRHYREEGPAL